MRRYEATLRKLIQIEDAIEDLMNYIENEDQLHWKGLNESWKQTNYKLSAFYRNQTSSL